MAPETIILYIIGYGIAFLIGVFITRAVFSVPKFIRCQEAQVRLLLELAKKMNVDIDRLNVIVAQYKDEPIPVKKKVIAEENSN